MIAVRANLLDAVVRRLFNRMSDEPFMLFNF
jgi:hypothetical protein